MTFTPFEYQDVGSDFLAGRRRALLLDAPGVGKTAQAILAADKIEADILDTICPASVRKQWGGEHTRISEYDRAFSAYSYEHARDRGISRRPTAIVLDELHYCGNINSGRTVKILGHERYGTAGLIDRAEYVWGMTGTLMTRDPSVLFPAMHAIVPGSLKLNNGNTMDEWQFLRKFCVMYDSGRGMRVVNGKNIDELRDRLAPYMLRRSKKDVRKDWKEPVIAELWLDPGKAGDLLHKAELEPEARAVADAFKRGGFDALAQLADTDRTGVSRYRRYIGMLKILPVIEWLKDEFDGGLEKIVIVAVHREVLEGLQHKLAEQKIAGFLYYGGMTDTEKDKVVKAFISHGGKAAMLGQIEAMGTGVDGLQQATGRMLYVEWSWLDTTNKQTLDRLDRIGQEENVLGQFAAFEGSLDGAIMSVAARRAKNAEQLFG